jgi:hypothetical protein
MPTDVPALPLGEEPSNGKSSGFALAWRRFKISDLPTTLGHGDGLAGALMRCTIKPREGSRMPAIREDDA